MLAQKESEIEDLRQADVRGILWLVIRGTQVSVDLASILHRHLMKRKNKSWLKLHKQPCAIRGHRDIVTTMTISCLNVSHYVYPWFSIQTLNQRQVFG